MSSRRNRSPPPQTMVRRLGRTMNSRILSVVIICAAGWLWLGVRNIVPTVVYNNQHKPLPPIVVHAPCNHTQPFAKATKLSQILFPVSDPENTSSWVGENNKMLRALFRCMELANCAPNQKKVILLGSFHFRGVLSGMVSGEDIWARSMIQALRDMGYTFLYTNNMERTVQLYHMLPELVKAVVVEAEDAFSCFNNEEDCVLSSRNLDGIPAWKIFSFSFWADPENPLGRNWTLSPEDYALEGHIPNTYLGYSVEPSCMSQPFIAPEDRDDRAYLMAKKLSLLEDSRDRAWPLYFFEFATDETGIPFIMGANDDVGGQLSLPPGLTNYGVMSQSDFVDALANSLVLVGVGRPAISPTPYEALCLGVPFINPILDWDRNSPQDRTKWYAQHGMLKHLDPPFVYNVFKDDLDGFVDAIANAVLNPIDRFVLDRMRMSAVTSRLRAILERDWKSEAAALLARRRTTGDDPLFTL